MWTKERAESYARQQEPETLVVFRKWRDGDVIALFPCEPGDMSPATCMSYMRVGQHGWADPRHVIRATTPALPHEYAALETALRRIGYRLRAVSRMQSRFFEARKAALRAVA